MRRYAIYSGVVLTFFMQVSAISCYADGLSALIEVGKSQEEMLKAENEETERFEEIRNAVESGQIRKGDSQESVAKKYGEPIIMLKDEDYAEKWVYKPASSSWFSGIKIYLFFDKDKNLCGIKIMNQ
ncbi:MAG: hypothetical protein A2Z72_04785 [Omnitrophica bacterium RBG_13_46_9]|nr:MAG: hypothetical protein A2Z72_04785 [Omnitrophica bacterium RBG_13_46_9]